MQTRPPSHPEYLLEKFVHHLLGDDPHRCRSLIADAFASGMDAQRLLSEVLWPASECVQQLKHDSVLLPQLFAHATRMLASLASEAAVRIPRMAAGQGAPRATARCLFVASAPGEPSDAGAHMLTLLAEAHGFTVYFAGAKLTEEEIFFALSRLEPDAVLIHGSIEQERSATRDLLARLRAAHFWPEIQTGVTGAILGAGGCGADVEARLPVELLEMLALCPEHRAAGPRAAAKTLVMPRDAAIETCDRAIRDLMLHFFPPRFRGIK
jgi:methanogenic corrinoid protein MtbC1